MLYVWFSAISSATSCWFFDLFLCKSSLINRNTLTWLKITPIKKWEMFFVQTGRYLRLSWLVRLSEHPDGVGEEEETIRMKIVSCQSSWLWVRGFHRSWGFRSIRLIRTANLVWRENFQQSARNAAVTAASTNTACRPCSRISKYRIRVTLSSAERRWNIQSDWNRARVLALFFCDHLETKLISVLVVKHLRAAKTNILSEIWGGHTR